MKIKNLFLSQSAFMIITVLGLMAGLAANWSIRVYGPGVSTDGVDYMFTALNLVNQRGFISYNDRPYTLWPPLYPGLLAIIQLALGINPLSAAWVLNLCIAAGLAIVLAIILSDLFPGRLDFAFAGGLIFVFSPAVFGLAQSVNTDYLLTLLVLIFFYDAGRYLSRRDWPSFTRLFLWGTLASLTRFLGVAVILSAAIIGFIYPPQRSRWRIWPALFQLFAGIPLLVWVLWSYQLETHLFGDRDIKIFSWMDTVSQILQLTAGGLFPSTWIENAREVFSLLALVIMGGMIIMLFLSYRKAKVSLPFQAQPIFIFAALYLPLLILSVNIAMVMDIQPRFLTPLILPIIVLFLLNLQWIDAAIRKQIRHARMKTLLLACVVLPPFILGAVSLSISLQIALNYNDLSMQLGNMYNNRAWHENEIVQHLRTKPFAENSVLYSNFAAGVAFHTWRTVFPSPRDSEAFDPNREYSLAPFRSLFNHPGKEMYLIWIEPNYYEHVFPPEYLQTIVNLKRLHRYEKGSAVYRISIPLDQ